MARAQKAGWYPDPQNPSVEREWDGSGWTQQTRMAPPAKKRRRGSLVLKIALGVALGLAVLIVGCAALIGGAANEVQEDSDKTAITLEQYNAVKTGERRSVVESRLGEPESRDEFSSEVDGLPDPVGQRCVYYNRKGEFASIFQLCFDVNTDKLESKSAV